MSAPAGEPKERVVAPRTGLLVTFEGGEGSGKSTQLDLLAGWLEEAGHEVVRTREPGTTAVGELVRNFLLETAPDTLEPEAELALFLAARAQLAAEIIAPALAAGRIVLVDRYGDSSVAYQGYGRGLDPDAIANANRWLTRGIDPDLTVLIEVPVGAARSRRQRPPDRLERVGRDFHGRVHEGYQRLAAAEPERFCVVNGNQAIDVIQTEIRDRLSTLLAERIPQEMERS